MTTTTCAVAFLSSFSLVFSPLAVLSLETSHYGTLATRCGVEFLKRPHIVPINRLQRSRFNWVQLKIGEKRPLQILGSATVLVYYGTWIF